MKTLKLRDLKPVTKTDKPLNCLLNAPESTEYPHFDCDISRCKAPMEMDPRYRPFKWEKERWD